MTEQQPKPDQSNLSDLGPNNPFVKRLALLLNIPVEVLVKITKVPVHVLIEKPAPDETEKPA